MFTDSGPFVRQNGKLWFVERLDEHRGHYFEVERLIHSEETAFQRIDVIETSAYGRILLIDGDPQSTEVDEFIYHEALIHPGLIPLAGKGSLSALVLGAGECASLREILRHPEVVRVVGVEIDPAMLEVARRYLPSWPAGALEDERVEMVIADASDFVPHTRERFDFIVLDLTTPRPGSPSIDLFKEEFIVEIKKLLKTDGILAAQADYRDLGRTRTAQRLAAFRRVFRHAASYGAYVPSFYCIWNFVLGSDEPGLIRWDYSRAGDYYQRHLAELRYLSPDLLTCLFARPKYVLQLG